MTGLLISVRNRQEAAAALAGGADLIDVKEPRHGSLGAADPRIWDEVWMAVNRKVPLSVSLGELLEDDAIRLANRAVDVQYAKIGLAGCGDVADWELRWKESLDSLRAPIHAVAVVYADWRAARAPHPEEVCHHAAVLGCKAILVDTFQKNGRGLFDCTSGDELSRLIDFAREGRMRIVLAGSLTRQTVPVALRLRPDYIAVRGAVCGEGRIGTLDARRVEKLAAFVRAWRSQRTV